MSWGMSLPPWPLAPPLIASCCIHSLSPAPTWPRILTLSRSSGAALSWALRCHYCFSSSGSGVPCQLCICPGSLPASVLSPMEFTSPLAPSLAWPTRATCFAMARHIGFSFSSGWPQFPPGCIFGTALVPTSDWARLEERSTIVRSWRLSPCCS